MAADPVFVDTNILVYNSRPSAPEHLAARSALARIEAEGAPLWISPQVMREYLAVVTRPQVNAPALTMATAIADIWQFRALFEIAGEKVPLCSTGCLSFWQLIQAQVNRFMTPTSSPPCRCTMSVVC